MTDRTVTYNFRGNFANLGAGLTAMGRGVTDLGVKLTALDKSGTKLRAGLTSVGSTAGKVGLVAAAGFAVAVGAAAKFEQSMSNVSAATHETTGNMELLRQAALDAGQATKFSATEAAGAIEELAKAGVSTTDILNGGLTGALDLAAAGGLEVADAAQIAATALTQFKLSGEDVPHVADLLAAGAGKAQGEVTDLAMALKQSGLVASQMGISIEDTTGTLSAFASAGLLGSDAGTSFKSMLQALTPNSTKAAKEMEALGLHFYDAQGQFVGLEAVAGQLQAALGGLSEEQRNSALETIFGSDAVRAASVLYSQGAQGIQDWTNKVNDQGYAAETAAIKMDNLSGDLEQLKGSLETAFIGAGSGSQGPLRQLVQGVTDVVNAFNKLPQSGQNAATGLLAVTAVLGGGLWFTSKAIQGIASTRQALSDLGITANISGGSLARVARTAGGIAAVAGAVTVLGNALANATGAKLDVSDLQRDLEALANGDAPEILSRLTSDFNILGQTSGKIVEPVAELGTAFGLFGNTGMDNASDNIAQVDEALASMVESGNAEMASQAFDKIAAAITGLPEGSSFSPAFIDGFDSYATALQNSATAAEGGAEATEDYGVAARQAAEASQAEADALNEAMKAMQDKTSATLAGFDAETAYRQALKDAEAQGKKSNAGIKGSTESALANRSALSGLASAWNNQSVAVKNNSERYKQARKDFIDSAQAMGVSADAAKRLADRVLEIPKSRVANVSVSGADAATQKVQTLNRELSKVVSRTITVTANVIRNGIGGLFAEGGYTGDGGVNEPAGVVHRGEVVIPQSLVKRDWPMLSARYGHLPGFAGGGYVGGSSSVNVSPLGFAADAAAQSLNALAGLGKKELTIRQRLLEKELDRDKKREDALRSQMESLTSSVADRFMSDLWSRQTSNFTLNAPDSITSAAQSLAWAQAQAQVNAQHSQGSDPGSILREDIRRAREMQRLLRQARRAGIDGGALAELGSNADADQIRALLADPRLARQYDRLYDRRSEVATATGRGLSEAIWGKRLERVIEARKEDSRELKLIRRKLEAIEKNTHDGPKKTGDAVGEKVNGAATAGQRRVAY